MDIQEELRAIKERNARVEADKAWETSLFRKILILIITYILASLALYGIGVTDFYISSLIPTLGYFLSTLLFPLIKKWWLENHYTQSALEND